VWEQVVLKNEGKLLPLDPKAKVAVLGPHFNSTVEFQSIYFGENKHVLRQSPLAAFKRRGVNVVGSAMGCDYTWCNTTEGFPDAVAAAKAADVAVVFIGLWLQENEGWDRIELRAPGLQENLVQAIFAANPRTVVVCINGGGLAVEWTYATVPAVVEGFCERTPRLEFRVSICLIRLGRLQIRVKPEAMHSRRSSLAMSRRWVGSR